MSFMSVGLLWCMYPIILLPNPADSMWLAAFAAAGAAVADAVLPCRCGIAFVHARCQGRRRHRCCCVFFVLASVSVPHSPAESPAEKKKKKSPTLKHLEKFCLAVSHCLRGLGPLGWRPSRGGAPPHTRRGGRVPHCPSCCHRLLLAQPRYPLVHDDSLGPTSAPS